MKNHIRDYSGISPKLENRVYIDPAATVIGDVSIGSDSSVWPCAVIRGDVNTVSIGERTNIQDGSVLHVTHAGPFCEKGWPLVIGDDVTIGHNATLHGCTICDKVLVGMGALVLDGAVIEHEVLLAAGAMVSPGKILESGFLYKGNPAKKDRALTEKELNFFLYSAAHYVRLKNNYLGHI